MKLSIALTLVAVSLGGLYAHTHTEKYVSAAYENLLLKECQDDELCLLGATILEKDTVECARSKVLSTSVKTLNSCLSQAIDKKLKERGGE